ncbi:unnamed protein product [Bursaphelenchus okinawaensis]|uniref:NAD-dependent epimerase/dehydratase domain-containing protein n=1 Tax=Bursaphelenchus okinawaensis TaxID=465554 RepID=A0A811L8C0_9BILA|nr:unnamed protein product [Bursaphelenchus okinawaensis]CAG9119832.1 unnamed protein product [Bursaphelenchus okinawaensis]
MLNKEDTILVTGASGYVALHCVQQLLQAGYKVRGTVRSLKNEQKVAPIQKLNRSEELLELVEADLMNEQDWPGVILGCSHILHVASPWPIVADESTIKTAVTGTLNVLKAAASDKNIKKVVLTSSCAAVNDGHKNDERVFDETCWTDITSKKVDNYAKSKTIAERKAWGFFESLDPSSRFELTVLNPTFITGPVLSSVEHGSATILARMMDFRTFLAAPRACLGVVDVRDVARAHILALKEPKTNGRRILVTHTRPTWFFEMRNWLMEEFKDQGYVFSPLTVPNWIVRAYAKTKLDKQSTAIVHRLGPELHFSNDKSVKLLNMTYIDPKKSVIDMMVSMIDKKMVRSTPFKKAVPQRSHKLQDSKYVAANINSTVQNVQ